MNILALDTSTDAISIALLLGDETLEYNEVAPREHTQKLAACVADLLDEAGLDTAQIDRFAFGCGPGSFTGVRISNGLVQGMAIAHDRPVVPISSMAALAYSALADRPEVNEAWVLNDARMNEVFSGVYQRCGDLGVKLVGGEQLFKVADVNQAIQASWLAVGSAWEAFPDELQNWRAAPTCIGLSEVRWPEAKFIAQMAAGLAEEDCLAASLALPNYLRESVADPRARVRR